jgi:hypothetical protein
MKTKLLAVAVLFAITCAATTVFPQNLNLSKINNRRVRYAVPSKVKVFPVPAIGWQRPGLATQAQKNEVLNKIVYPVINKSSNAIAAVIIEFYTGDKKSFSVEVLYHNGGQSGILFHWNKQGKINTNDYQQFFERLPGD